MKPSSKSPDQTPLLLVGLGNPGPKYARHRHNIGFMAIDRMAEDYRFPAFKSKFQGEISEGRIEGEKVILLKPQTYMNESGRAVGAAAKFYKITSERIFVFHDELDLAAGKMRIKQGGGNAGHNGLKSTQSHLGTPDFWRVRLGIGHPGSKDKVTPHVLGDFAKADQEWLEPLLDGLSRNLPLLLSGEKEEYMSQVARNSKA